MTGIKEPLYTAVDVKDVGHNGVEVSRNGYGYYTYFPMSTAAEPYLKYNFMPEQDTLLYAYLSVDKVEEVDIYQNERYTFSQKLAKQPYIFPLGSYKAGEKATLKWNVDRKSIQNGAITLFVYALNQDVLEQGYQQLAAGGLQVTDWSDTRLTGTLNADHDGICYLSIPAEDGWHITVDGKQTEPISIGGAMLGVPVSSGTHTIALRYCPKGTVVGTIYCGSAILLLTFCFVIEQKQKRACRSNSVGRRRKTCEP